MDGNFHYYTNNHDLSPKEMFRLVWSNPFIHTLVSSMVVFKYDSKLLLKAHLKRKIRYHAIVNHEILSNK